MGKLRSDYQKRRAELIVGWREQKPPISYNKIAAKLDHAISPQRVAQIEAHYYKRVNPKIEKSTRSFLDIFRKS